MTPQQICTPLHEEWIADYRPTNGFDSVIPTSVLSRQALIDYIEGGHSLNEFLDDFPTVTREVAALEQAKAHLIADARAA